MQPDRYIRSLYVYGVTVDPNTSVRFITSLFVCTKNASHLGISISPLKCVSATSCARPLRIGPRSAPGIGRLTARNLFEVGALPPHPRPSLICPASPGTPENHTASRTLVQVFRGQPWPAEVSRPTTRSRRAPGSTSGVLTS